MARKTKAPEHIGFNPEFLRDDVYMRRLKNITHHIDLCRNCFGVSETWRFNQFRPGQRTTITDTDKIGMMKFYKEAGKICPFFFCKFILNYTDMQEHAHLELSKFLWEWDLSNTEVQQKKLIMMPRGTFKSSIITIGYIVQRIIANPNIRILIDNATLRNSIKYLGAIKNHFQYNSLIHQTYGYYSPDKRTENKLWREDSIIVTRRSDTRLKEPTVDTTSVDTGKVGMHYDMIIYDDLHDEHNVTTPDQLTKVLDHFLLTQDILDPAGKMIVVGTKWSYLDLYHHIIENEAQDSEKPDTAKFKIFIREAINPDGTYLFPEKLGEKALAAKRELYANAGRLDFYYMQYFNKVISSDTQEIKVEKLKYYEDSDLTREINNQPPLIKQLQDVALYIDPAFSTSTRADRTALIVTGVLNRKQDYPHVYVLDAIALRLPPNDIIKEVLKLIDKWKLYDIYCEKGTSSRVINTLIDLECRKSGKWIKLSELDPMQSKNSKYDRIRGNLSSILDRECLFVKSDMKDLILELSTFPKGHDDMLDALAYAIMNVRPVTYYESVPQPIIENQWTGY